jgi:hypothetical protein
MLTITHSSKTSFLTCHKKYFWEYDQILKPKEESWSLKDGSAIHLGLEWLYKNMVVSIEHALQGFPNTLKWADLKDFYPKLDYLYEGDETSLLHKEIVKILLEGYTLIYRPDEFDTFQAEVKGEVFISNPYMKEGGFILAFKTDALVLKVDKQYLFETKTTSANTLEQFLDGLRFDDQSHTYIYGFRRLKYPILGMIYNVLRKPKLRQGKYETTDKFIERIRKEIFEDANRPMSERKYYWREYVYRSPVELTEWEEDIKNIAKDMESYSAYPNSKQCGFMYGDRCPYLPLCSGGDMTDAYIKKVKQHEELA